MTHVPINDSDYPSSFKYMIRAINAIGQEMNERNEKAKQSTSFVDQTVESSGASALEFSYKVMLDGLKYSQMSRKWWQWPQLLMR